MENRHGVDDALDVVQHVRREQNRLALFARGCERAPEEVPSYRRVEPDGRVVEYEQVGVLRERDRELGAASLAGAQVEEIASEVELQALAQCAGAVPIPLL